MPLVQTASTTPATRITATRRLLARIARRIRRTNTRVEVSTRVWTGSPRVEALTGGQCPPRPGKKEGDRPAGRRGRSLDGRLRDDLVRPLQEPPGDVVLLDQLPRARIGHRRHGARR